MSATSDITRFAKRHLGRDAMMDTPIASFHWEWINLDVYASDHNAWIVWKDEYGVEATDHFDTIGEALVLFAETVAGWQ